MLKGKRVMIIRTKTIAISSAALLIAGGAAYAAITAGSATGSGSVTTSTVAPGLTLSANATGANPIGTPAGVEIPVLATNASAATLGIPSFTTSISGVTPGECPAESFVLGAYTSSATTVAPGATNTQIGTVLLKFVDSSDSAYAGAPNEDQAACLGAAIGLTFGA